MKSKAFLNKAMVIMTALTVAIQPATALAEEQTQNPTEASTTVEYEGVDAYYSVVVPTTIQLGSDGTAEFSVKATGDLGGWEECNGDYAYHNITFSIYSKDEDRIEYPGCYLYQDGKEPIFAEFHEEADTICTENIMEQEGIKNYKECESPCSVKFCNPLPSWVRDITLAEISGIVTGFPSEWFAGMDEGENEGKKQFSHCFFGYDFGTTVPITVNLEGNKPVPAGDWEGKIMIGIENGEGFIPGFIPKEPDHKPLG